jgi:hypothetical protein
MSTSSWEYSRYVIYIQCALLAFISIILEVIALDCRCIRCLIRSIVIGILQKYEIQQEIFEFSVHIPYHPPHIDCIAALHP